MSFEFPTNIKQIGTITEGLKIYMEDYVSTYLHQISEDAKYEEQLAFLIGRNMVIDGQEVLFISGAIKAHECVLENNILKFTRRTWELLKEDNEKYFKELEVVGWMEAQAGYGASLSSTYEEYHKHKFRESYQVMFVIDTLENLESFYTWNNDMSGLQETKGYFVYYDKNRNMHEYMLSNKSISIKKVIDLNPDKEELLDEKEDFTNKNEDFTNKKVFNHSLEDRPRNKTSRKNNDIDYITDKKPSSEDFKSSYQRQNKNSVENWRVQSRASTGSRNNVGSMKGDINLDNKRLLNMLVSLSGVLFVVCFVMGTGLLQNEDRIASMENELNEIHTAYKDLLVANNALTETAYSQVNEDESASVFASQTDTLYVEAEDNNSYIELDIIEEFTADNLEITKEVVETSFTENEVVETSFSENEVVETSFTENEVVETSFSENEVVETSFSENEVVETSFSENEVVETSFSENEVYNEELSEITKEEENVSFRTYTVQDGDSLARISLNHYGTTSMMESIMAINNIDDPDKIFVGKELLIP